MTLGGEPVSRAERPPAAINHHCETDPGSQEQEGGTAQHEGQVPLRQPEAICRPQRLLDRQQALVQVGGEALHGPVDVVGRLHAGQPGLVKVVPYRQLLHARARSLSRTNPEAGRKEEAGKESPGKDRFQLISILKSILRSILKSILRKVKEISPNFTILFSLCPWSLNTKKERSTPFTSVA